MRDIHIIETDPSFFLYGNLFFQVVGFGKHERDAEVTAVSGAQSSSSANITHLKFLPSLTDDFTCIKDIKAFT